MYFVGEFNSQFIVQDLNRLLRFDEGQDFLNSMKGWYRYG